MRLGFARSACTYSPEYVPCRGRALPDVPPTARVRLASVLRRCWGNRPRTPVAQVSATRGAYDRECDRRCARLNVVATWARDVLVAIGAQPTRNAGTCGCRCDDRLRPAGSIFTGWISIPATSTTLFLQSLTALPGRTIRSRVAVTVGHERRGLTRSCCRCGGNVSLGDADDLQARTSLS